MKERDNLQDLDLCESTVELGSSGLIGTANHPYIKEIRII